ncbi:MAG TPA: hypothetical protein VIC84_09045 [Blastocatellia bacterium]|jgi:hypothetical protein
MAIVFEGGDGEEFVFDPLIEGEFHPGIYDTGLEGLDAYYYIPTVEALEDILHHVFIDFDDEEEKVLCLPDRIELIEIASEKPQVHTLTKVPETFFDVFCPICNTQLRGYTVLADYYNRCEVTEPTPCSHYLGLICAYEEDELADLKMSYKFEENELFLRLPTGEWVKPMIYNVPGVSYWRVGEDSEFTTDFIILLPKHFPQS